MATATEIATRALKRLAVIGAGETPAAADVADMTTALNAMIASWEAEGLSGDVLPLDARFEKAVVDMLAVDQAETYGKQPGPILMRDAANGWTQIQSAFIGVPNSTFDNALKWTGNLTDIGYIIGYDCEAIAQWRANTVYALRQFVINNANIYECITAGTSAGSGGPTGTGSEITDGTVVWCWRRVTG
jgi:hypothetical protein